MKTPSKDGAFILVTDHNFVEENYLESNPDVAKAVYEGVMESGKLHFELYGRNERRKMRRPSLYLSAIANTVLHFFGKKREEQITGRQYGYLQAQIRDLQAKLKDFEVMSNQLQAILHLEHGICPAPPKHLQIRVVGSYVPDFIESGFNSIYPDLNLTLRAVGKNLDDFHTILDFGCGCGRAIRALAKLLPNCELHGTDIDKEAIEWLKSNYSKVSEFSVSPHAPPTIYKDHMFDFVFGISVFTHLPEEMQFQWLGELSRIITPGGYAIMTTHGEKHYNKLDEGNLDIMRTKGFVYVDSHYGESISLPEFYQTAFHSDTYIIKEWGRYFDVVDIQPLGMQNHQDTILLQKRA